MNSVSVTGKNWILKKYDQEKYKPYKDLLKRFSNKYYWLNKK